MDRAERANEKYIQLFGEAPQEISKDPDFMNILQRFIFGEVFYEGEMEDKLRELLTISVLTTNQTFPQLKAHTKGALHTGASAEEIKETVYQCAPYIGFAKVLNALEVVNEVFESENIPLPLASQSTTTEQTRMEKGLAVQKSIFGEDITKAYENAPDNQVIIQEYLSAMCFGDFYTRTALDIKTRELITFCVLVALGGCENQIKAHIKGNLSVGNQKQTLLTALIHCILYMGFPRTLNALACINEVLADA